MDPPERVEGPVEHREIVTTVDEQGAARVVHVLAHAEVHVWQRGGDIEQAPDVHLEAEDPQQAAEHEQVVEQGGHALAHTQRAAARPIRATSVSPWTAPRYRPWT